MNKSSLIDKYFQNNLSSEEKITLHELLKSDMSFAKEFSFQKDVQIAIQLAERKSLKLFLQELEQNYTIKNRFVLSKKWLVAASISLMLSFLGTVYFFNSDGNSNEELYAAYFAPYSNVEYPITRSETLHNIKRNAFIAYEMGDFSKAEKLLNKAYEESKNIELLFYKGISLLSQNKQQEGSGILQFYLTQGTKYRTQANWYLALSNLQLGKKERAKKYLLEVINSTGDFKKKESKILLEKIE